MLVRPAQRGGGVDADHVCVLAHVSGDLPAHHVEVGQIRSCGLALRAGTGAVSQAGFEDESFCHCGPPRVWSPKFGSR